MFSIAQVEGKGVGYDEAKFLECVFFGCRGCVGVAIEDVMCAPVVTPVVEGMREQANRGGGGGSAVVHTCRVGFVGVKVHGSI